MIVVKPVNLTVNEGELTVCQEKPSVTRYRLIKKLDRFKIFFSLAVEVNAAVVDKLFCSQVELVRVQVRRRAFLDSRFLLWRQLRLKLSGNCVRNLALDRKDVT